MPRLVPAGLVLASLGTLAPAAPAMAQETLEGAWIATGWASGGQTFDQPQRGLLVFTKGHYSMMFVAGQQARPRYTGDSLTDAEKLAAYDSFIANAGRYTVSGNTITTKAYMAKDPNYMGQWGSGCATGACPNDTDLSFELEGTTLTVTWPDQFAGGRVLVGTFRRVE